MKHKNLPNYFALTKSRGQCQQWRMHWGGQGGQSATPDSEKIAKNQEKEGENREKRRKIGKKRQKSGMFFHLPLLTDRAGYTTECQSISTPK